MNVLESFLSSQELKIVAAKLASVTANLALYSFLLLKLGIQFALIHSLILLLVSSARAGVSFKVISTRNTEISEITAKGLFKKIAFALMACALYQSIFDGSVNILAIIIGSAIAFLGIVSLLGLFQGKLAESYLFLITPLFVTLAAAISVSNGPVVSMSSLGLIVLALSLAILLLRIENKIFLAHEFLYTSMPLAILEIISDSLENPELLILFWKLSDLVIQLFTLTANYRLKSILIPRQVQFYSTVVLLIAIVLVNYITEHKSLLILPVLNVVWSISSYSLIQLKVGAHRLITFLFCSSIWLFVYSDMNYIALSAYVLMTLASLVTLYNSRSI